MSFSIEPYRQEFESAISHLTDDFATLRVGRANPLMVEMIMVEAYGAKVPIKQIASITVPDVRTLVIQPWDKSTVKDVEKGVMAANIGVGVINEGQQIRLTVPQLTEESRRELTKSIGEKAERARISIRQIRDKVRELIIEQEKEGEIREDDRFSFQEKLDEMAKAFTDRIGEMADRKKEEIMKL